MDTPLQTPSGAPPVQRNSSEPTHGDFPDWFAGIIEDERPALVVCMARGALRLVQLRSTKEIRGGVRVISHHALPFLSDADIRGKKVLLLDDSVIFGSSIARVRDYLSGRGAIVSCAAYVVDRTHFFGERPPQSPTSTTQSEHAALPLRYKHLLWPNAMQRHHASLVRSILQTSLNYNPDFPTLRFKLPPFVAGDIPYIAECLRNLPMVRGFFDVSSPASASANVFRFTGLLEPTEWEIFANDEVHWRPYSKLRVTFSPRSSEVSITPIVQLTVEASLRHRDIRLCDSSLSALWEEFVFPADNDQFYVPSLFRLITAFVATVVGQAVARGAARCMSARSVSLDTADVLAILGDENGISLDRAFYVMYDNSYEPVERKAVRVHEKVLEQPNAAEIRKEIVQVCNKFPECRPNRNELPWESVGKVFLTLRAATDSREHRKLNPFASRLDVGLTYAGVAAVLKEFGINSTADETSLAVDLCVDNGLAVPKIIVENGRCFRAFYCGEDEDDQATLQFKAALYRGYLEHLHELKGTALSPFDMQKICATLKNLLPWLPISTGPYRFGWVATVGESGLIPWLTDKEIGPLRIAVESGRKVLRPHDGFRQVVKPTWSSDQSRDFLDAFQYVAMAFASLTDEAKLLISTCRNHAYAYNAVAFEIHAWAGYQRDTFGKLIELLQGTVAAGRPLPPTALQSLYWSARYLSEARKKYRVFHQQFGEHASELKKALYDQGLPAARWWEYSGQKMLDSSEDPEIKERFGLLLPFVYQATHVPLQPELEKPPVGVIN